MDLSSGSPNPQQDYLKFTRGQRSNSNSPLFFSNTEAETIDISKINFEDDESWLCSSNNRGSVTDVEDWLHKDLASNSLSHLSSSIDLQKHIDTRTFTRPKKRYTRPSIEQYNDDMYGSSSETVTILADSKSYVIVEKSEPRPNFDLSQPSSSYYFEKLVADSEQADSFQNMSPPSLVNSMCSSTFANLMESSFIKNDPILREIRDADYSESVLLQDCETPMFYSISESCSSLNSDTPENFLRKVSFNGSFRKNFSKDTTFNKASEEENVKESTLTNTSEREQSNQTFATPNGTYRRTPKHNNTFKKSDIKKSQALLQATFEVQPQDDLHSNRTHTIIQDCGSIENIKKGMSDPVEICTDLNRLSYCLEDENPKLDVTYNDVNRTTNLKSSILSGSVGSADSLDRLSSMSSSSRGSNKMLNMADVDAIVEMQERSLQQVMSTPKPATTAKLLWENNFISPIVAREASDSDLSSTEEYKSVRSTQSSKTSLENYIPRQPPKTINCVGSHLDTRLKINQKPSYTVTAPKPMAAVKSQIHNSKNVRNSNIAGSNPNIHKVSGTKAANAPVSNLKNMGPKLKGSYTSLRPMSAILPVAPPLNSNSTQNIATSKNGTYNVTHTLEGGTRIVEVQPMPREKTIDIGDAFVKPPQPKTSGLPRPTGIPRPTTATRIPGPRTSNLRPITSRPTFTKRVPKS